jgi:hypothetical protein
MWGRLNSKRTSRLETALRAHRAEARADFVDDIGGRIAAPRPRAGRAWSRLAFASAVSVLILGTFASFGGLSYAASGAAGTYDAAKKVVVTHKVVVKVHTSSAAGQYPSGILKPPKTVVKNVKTVKTVHPHHAALPAQTVTAGTLPFTGVSLLATFVVSLGLIGAGLFLRRRERRD